MPDISSKDKAQEYIGLDMKTLQDNKDKWIKTVVPEWLKKAKENGRIVASL
jgi:nitrite reductase (cytochrome c-552)